MGSSGTWKEKSDPPTLCLEETWNGHLGSKCLLHLAFPVAAMVFVLVQCLKQSMASPTPKHRSFLIPQFNRLNIKQNNTLGNLKTSSYEWNFYLFSCSFLFHLLQNLQQTVEFAP